MNGTPCETIETVFTVALDAEVELFLLETFEDELPFGQDTVRGLWESYAVVLGRARHRLAHPSSLIWLSDTAREYVQRMRDGVI